MLRGVGHSLSLQVSAENQSSVTAPENEVPNSAVTVIFGSDGHVKLDLI